MVVERARGESQSLSGSLQSLCWGSAAVGGIVSAYFSGSLVESYGTRFVFGLTALLPLITSAAGVLVREERVVENATRGHLAGAGGWGDGGDGGDGGRGGAQGVGEVLGVTGVVESGFGWGDGMTGLFRVFD